MMSLIVSTYLVWLLCYMHIKQLICLLVSHLILKQSHYIIVAYPPFALWTKQASNSQESASTIFLKPSVSGNINCSMSIANFKVNPHENTVVGITTLFLIQKGYRRPRLAFIFFNNLFKY